MSDASKSFKVWWVNQGHTYARAKADGFLWAPIPVAGGQSFPHWESMTLVEPGDLVINYGHKAIVAISLVRSTAVKHANRKKEGWRVDVDYHDLPEPITIEDIKPYLDEINASIETNRPFDEFQGIQQGYLFHFSHTGFNILTGKFGARLPQAINRYLGLGSDMGFSGYCHDEGFVFDSGLVDRYVLSLKTRPFLILSGHSGTGKTRLAQLFARYLHARAGKQDAASARSAFLSRRWFKLSFNDQAIVNAFEGRGKKINRVRKTILKDGIMSLMGLDSKKETDMNQKKMMKDLQEGDVIIAYQGGYTVGGIGVVTQPHFVDDSGDAYDSFYESTKNFIRVDWQYKGPLKISDFFMEDNRIPAFSMWSDTIHQLNGEQIARFADYLAGKDIRIDAHGINERAMTYAVVPVGHGWTGLKHLLGFYDSTLDDYQITPALALIMNACKALSQGKDKESLFFLILDGMNTSNPDHYLAEILSAMESGEPVFLHTSDEVEQYAGIPKQLVLPTNLCLVGTLHAGSVTGDAGLSLLDRAHVIELPEPSGASYARQHSGPTCFPCEPSIFPLYRMGAMAHSHIFEKMAGIRVPDDEHSDFHELMTVELDLLQALVGNMGMPFGFRVIHDIMLYLYVAWDADRRPVLWTNWAKAMDILILQKILPRIRGEYSCLESYVKALYGCCFFEIRDPRRQEFARKGGQGLIETLVIDKARYKQSARKLKGMLDDGARGGRISFFPGNCDHP